MGAAVTVAKKRSKPGPKPTAEGPREAMVSMKCRAPWKEWLVEYAKFVRTSPASLIDMALADRAKREGFREPPER